MIPPQIPLSVSQAPISVPQASACPEERMACAPSPQQFQLPSRQTTSLISMQHNNPSPISSSVKKACSLPSLLTTPSPPKLPTHPATPPSHKILRQQNNP